MINSGLDMDERSPIKLSVVAWHSTDVPEGIVDLLEVIDVEWNCSEWLPFNCADVQGALNQTYTIMAAADAHAGDPGTCPVFQIYSMTCFNALADDDNDSSDNRATTNGFRVK